MSDKKSEQKSAGWMVTIVGGLIAALGGIGVAIFNNWEKLPLPGSIKPLVDSPSVQAEIAPSAKDTGDFLVHANDSGYDFRNETTSRQTYEFTADGRWTYNPSLELHGPNGRQDLTATEGYNLPGFAEGALVVRREDRTYQFIGRHAALDLEPGESIVFTINDMINEDNPSLGYNDNEGTLKVTWNCRTCR